MVTALATTNGTHQAAKPETALDLDLLKRTVCKGSTDDEFKLFAMVCQRTGLDPFARQIHAVKRWHGKEKREVMSIQTGIDGYRLIADRTGLYAGSDEPKYDTESAQHPGKASVTVWKLVAGQRVPFTRSARWDEFVQTKNTGEVTRFWAKMPYLMLGKVAEALALRAAFPQELSGIYTHEEMDQATIETETVRPIIHHPEPAKQLPLNPSEPVKNAAAIKNGAPTADDYVDVLKGCKSLPELIQEWDHIPTHLQKILVPVKDALKARFAASSKTQPQDDPPEADHATGDGDAAPQSYIGRELAQAILDGLSKLGIDWSEVRDNHGKGAGLADIAGFQSMFDIKVTELTPEQGLRLHGELKKRLAAKPVPSKAGVS